MAKQQDFPGYLPDSHRILWLLMRVGLMIWGVYGLFHGSVVEFLQAIFAILFTHMWDYFQVFGGRSFITRVDYISGTMLNVFIFLGVVIGTTLNNRTDFKGFDIVTHFCAGFIAAWFGYEFAHIMQGRYGRLSPALSARHFRRVGNLRVYNGPALRLYAPTVESDFRIRAFRYNGRFHHHRVRRACWHVFGFLL